MKPFKILVVEDNVEWYNDFQDNLKKIPPLGLIGSGDIDRHITHVTNQADADQAIVNCNGESYDLILLDLNYPQTPDKPLSDKLTGTERDRQFQGMMWLPELRRLQPMAAIVILTSYAADNHLRNAVEAIRDYDANDFIPKTASFHDIVARIRVAWMNAQRMKQLILLEDEMHNWLRTRAARTYVQSFAEDVGSLLRRAIESSLTAVRHLESHDASLITRAADTIRIEQKQLKDAFDNLTELLTIGEEGCRLIDVVELMQQMGLLYRNASKATQVRMMLPSEPAELRISTYESDLKVALHELITNALDALKTSSRRAEERLLKLDVHRFGKEVVIEIADNANGFSKEALENLYRQGYSTKRRKDHPHQGIGLYIAKRMVNHLGGAIEIESREGEGTTVRLTLKDLE